MKHRDHAQCTIAQNERNRDFQVRFQLALTYEGLLYLPTDYPAKPRQVYKSLDGYRYIKHGAGDYRRLKSYF